jgi:hypothetical protein
MSEEKMVDAVQRALADRGVTDEVIAAGQFNPRGHTGGLFIGGLTGNAAGGALGAVGEAAGLAVGSVAGMHGVGAISGLDVKVHKRVNVRVLELIDSQSGSQIELEGSRVGITHSKDVIEALAGESEADDEGEERT